MKFIKKFGVAAILLLFCAAITIMYFVTPKQNYSGNEKRVLSEFPAITFESLISGELGDSLETWLADHMPQREFFVGVDAYFKLLSGRNGEDGIYACRDGYLMAAPFEYNEDQIQKNVSNINAFVKDSGLDSKLIVVPTAGSVLSERLPAMHGEYEDDKLFSDVMELLDGPKLIDVRDTLKFHADEGMYYRTDHHLTSAGAETVYRAYCESVNREPTEFRVSESEEGFYGTGYSKSGLWLTKPDAVEIRTPEEKGNFIVTITESGETRTAEDLFFREHFKEDDKYPVFLDGNHAVVTVENTDAPTGRRLLIVKDSYAHCFATLEAYDCDIICMVDLRYYKGSVHSLVEEYGLNEALFIYGAENLNSMTDLGWLAVNVK